MTVETQLLREIADRVVEARNARTVLDTNEIALAFSRKHSNSEMSAEDIRNRLEETAVAQGATILSESSSGS